MKDPRYRRLFQNLTLVFPSKVHSAFKNSVIFAVKLVLQIVRQITFRFETIKLYKQIFDWAQIKQTFRRPEDGSSKTLANFYQTIQRYNLQDRHFQIRTYGCLNNRHEFDLNFFFGLNKI